MTGSGDETGEAKLFHRAAAGDADAFTRIFELYYPMIHAFAYRLCLDASDADEIAQETFVKAARAMAGVRNPGGLRAWLFSIARNTAADLRRSDGRRAALNEAAAGIEQRRSEERATDFTEVAEALRALPGHLREAIVLTFFEEMSHADAAYVLGCAETTVSWRVFKAKRHLKKILSGNA